MSEETILRLVYAVALLILIWPGFRAMQRGVPISSTLFQIGLWVAIALVAAFIYSFF